MAKKAKEGAFTEFIVFAQDSSGFVRTWDDVIGIGDEIDFGGCAELWDIQRTYLRRFFGKGGGMSKPLLAKVVDREDADYVIWKGDEGSKSFLIWRINEPSAPVDKPDVIFVRSQEVEIDVKFDVEDHIPGQAKY